MDASRTASRRAFSSQTSAEGPTSKRTERSSEPRRPVTSAEKPWQARHRCPQGSTQSWPSLGARWGTRATSRPSSGSCGTPLSTLDSVSLSLSTTTSRSSASSDAISIGFIALSCRLATLAAPGSRHPEAAQGAPWPPLHQFGALSVLTVNARRDVMRYAPCPKHSPCSPFLLSERRPRDLSTWLAPASYRPAACRPIKSLHHVIDDAQRTERT